MALNVTLKQQCATNPAQIPNAFRQIETWANSTGWQDIVLDSGWTTVAGFQVPQFYVDPFGWCNLRGSCNNFSSATPLPICTLPPNCWPPATDIVASITADSTFGWLQMSAAGVLSFYNNGGGVDANQIGIACRFCTFF